ncbi:exodeoxyribonuclease VII small subunit [Fructilactobacillus carniphilus]|uniref:Exodeoxyribonuclease 7 small subunit n=1 Tax=Fructilactobacillus carniphilus TaxID=2940297 RepID=A0ABY5BXA9_9LACO|nr:exodeoxyribonuclease VII small subunit [Fructilactobacillus carniphilus]USS91146.1 exodeoxyribonuclease VII small subunit [Fructilactobacillus carniphilus]
MPTNKPTFEDNMQHLEQIVQELQNGNVPLEKALSEFQTGVKLSQAMQQTLQNAEDTLTKMMTSDGEEVPFTRDKGYEKQAKTDKQDDEDVPF